MRREQVLMLLRSRRTEDRIRAVEALGRSPEPDDIPLLLEALRDRSHYVAALAATGLSEAAPREFAPELLERFDELAADGLKRDPGCHIRAHLAFALGRLEYGPAIESLRAGIRTHQIEPVAGVPTDTAGELRANAALALAELHAPDALLDIAILLFDTGTSLPHAMSDPRKAAALALARLAEPEAIVPLGIKLTYGEHELSEVLAACMEAVVELEHPRAVALLRPYLHHTDQHLAAHAALLIARTRVPEAPVLLQEIVPRLAGDPLRAVLLGLVSLRSEEARGVLHGFVRAEREAVRLAAVEALSGSRDEATRDLLRSASQDDPSAAVRNAAGQAIE